MLEQKIYSLTEVANKTNLTEEKLLSFCKLRYIPGVDSDSKTPRFDEYDVQWTRVLIELEHSRMTSEEIQKYAELFAQGGETIPERKKMLADKRQELEAEIYDLQSSINFIDYRNQYYDRITEQDIDGAAEVLLESDMCMF